MRAFVLAGGQGTRLRPLTLTRPKPLVPLAGSPFAEGLLRRLRAAEGGRATFLVGADGHRFEPLHALGTRLGVDVEVLTEEAPLGTAGAVRRALAGVAEPALVLNGDVLSDLDLAALLARHVASGADATLALTRVADTRAYGVVVTDAAGTVRRFVEKPAPGTVDDDTVNAGTYVLSPGVFDGFPGDGPLSFEREVFPTLLDTRAHLHGVVDGGCWADLGTPERLRLGHREILEGRCAWPLGDDVVVRDGVALHGTARVAQGAELRPPVTLGPGVVVESGAVLEDAVLLPDVRVEHGARLRGVVLGEGVVVGAGAVLEGDVAVGDRERIPAGAALRGVVRLPESS